MLLAGALLGLIALYLNWTGDGRGIDYLRPDERFQAGYMLPLPLTLLTMGAVVGIGAVFLSGIAGVADMEWRRPVYLRLGVIGGLVMGTFPILAHVGYSTWRYWNDFGVGVFRSGDWSVGLWLALAGGSLALAGAALSARMLGDKA